MLPGDLQGRSRHVDDDDDDDDDHDHDHDDDDDDDDWGSSMNVEVPRGGKIKPLLRIFNECKRLTGVGEINPYWRSSMNVRV